MNTNIEKLLVDRIKQLNKADAQFCEDRWSAGKNAMEKQLAREESNKVTFARQELQAVLAAIVLNKNIEIPLIKEGEQKDYGTCQKCQDKKATADYNGHGFCVCGGCYDSLSNYFDKEYN